ncbi:PepSY domain-containing protein [Thalassolituus oleivorans]|uniref:Propeptide PepSY amd peptidase M4 n=2 Tax=root TaxID=1 RepID=M5DXK6_9GAMM|nr:PepSY domain-containing protein [Thalassolituus oleivorans]MBQ0726206.1 PepSY domain-containing protein [Thalassolituus oleivorans]MBQ0779505.1 PepSY domain-containing protein [Thalassolituus oleivorans]CCU74094.1 propeptide PepSY amd peptidase M4 [Thalassolituus oleivorans MIL-1]
MKITWLFLAMAVGTINPAFAEKHPNAAQVRAWVEQGEILSLESILQLTPLGGELLDAEVEWEKGMLTYELKWLDAQGQRHEAYVDARTGKVIKVESEND